MRVIELWTTKAVKDKTPQCIYDLQIHPEGHELLVTSGHLIQVIDALTGSILNKLKGHKDLVYCLSYTRDGTGFASGGADKTVIIWNGEKEPVLKYTHGHSIQCMAYSPVSHLLLSCTAADFVLWTQEQKSASTYKAPARITCCSWTNDGQYFAIGCYNGLISIRTKGGEGKVKIDRSTTNPVWSLSWNPSRDDRYDILTVCDWNQKLSYYHINGKQIGKDCHLGYDPCCVSYFSNGDFALIGGSNKRASLYTRDGVCLGAVGDQQSWVWSCRPKPGTNPSAVVVGSQDGTISCYNLVFSTVHGLYREKYAYRDKMTDVVVQDLLTDDICRIKCRDLVKRIAIYKNRLAVILPEKLLVFESVTSDGERPTPQYRELHRIQGTVQCSLLVVCSHHLILCQEKKLVSLTLSGEKERQWVMESPVRYIKVVGGAPGREGLLVGLRAGHVLKVFVDNPFPVTLTKQQAPIRCLDLSASRTKLAVVDENNVLMVYNLLSKELLYQEPNAASVSWNLHCEDMLCFSGSHILSIKASNFPPHQQKQEGFVVGFVASKIFCLHSLNMKTIDVPQSAPMVQYVERKLYKDAYSIACLGVTEEDWRLLAMEALEGLELEVAMKAFTRLRDLKFINLLHSIEERKKRGEDNKTVFLADIYAYEGKFTEAAQLYKKAGTEQKAVDMFTDLRQFDLAREFMSQSEHKGARDIISKQAKWAKDTNNPETACDMFLEAGEYEKALEIMGERGWNDRIVNLAHELDASKDTLLHRCAYHLRNTGQFAQAADIYVKLGDNKSVVTLYVETFQWENAFDFVKTHEEFQDVVYMPYATWLIENDRYDEAQEALNKAGRQSEAVHLLEELAENAVTEKRFEDAGYYYWMLAKSSLDNAKKESRDPTGSAEVAEKLVSQFRQYLTQSESYHLYSTVHQFIDQPFTNHLPDLLLNTSAYLLHILTEPYPRGISRFAILFTIAKYGKQSGAFKLARHALERIAPLRVPVTYQESVDMMSITIKAKPFQDKEELLPVCYRCSTTNPLLRSTGNSCVSCQQPFEYSFVSFEPLPVMEFVLKEGISDEEAMKLIQMDPPQKKSKGPAFIAEGNTQTLVLERGEEEEEEDDPFAVRSIEASSEFQPTEVDRDVLARLHRTEVLVKQWGAPIGNQYYRALMPDFPISLCSNCNKMFLADDYEEQGLCKGHCPFCRRTIDTLQS